MKEIAAEESQNTKLMLDHKDVLFLDFIIAHITSKLKNWIFAEFEPHTIYLLYGIQLCLFESIS